MIWWIVVVVAALLVRWFYRQSVREFRINQADADHRTALQALWKEGVPIVVRDLRRVPMWSRADVERRPCYGALSIFRDQGLVEWIATVGAVGAVQAVEIPCPWKEEQAAVIAEASGVGLWIEQQITPLFEGMEGWRFVRSFAWAGRVGCQRTYAAWTCLLPSEGDIVVSLFPENMEPYLPRPWQGSDPTAWTVRDTPFVHEIKYVDVIVRAGSALFLPPHWFMAWKGREGVPMVFTVQYHSPVSWLAWTVSTVSTVSAASTVSVASVASVASGADAREAREAREPKGAKER